MGPGTFPYVNVYEFYMVNGAGKEVVCTQSSDYSPFCHITFKRTARKISELFSYISIGVPSNC
jgi:hypothetical protein